MPAIIARPQPLDLTRTASLLDELQVLAARHGYLVERPVGYLDAPNTIPGLQVRLLQSSPPAPALADV
jgi:hypothetical protein